MTCMNRDISLKILRHALAFRSADTAFGLRTEVEGHLLAREEGLIIIRLILFNLFFGIRLGTKVGMEEKVHLRVATTGWVTMHERDIYCNYLIGEPGEI